MKTLAIREAVLELTDEYDVMTVRQCFYQLVARGIVPKSESGGYRPVQTQLLRMRRDGLLPWRFIADGTRWQRKPETWDTVEDAMREMQQSYRRNLWRSQAVRIEVWLEKDALAAVVGEETQRWDVPLMVSRGQSSDTFVYGAARAAAVAFDRAEVETIVFALYDYDGAGAEAAAAIRRKFAQYAPGVPVMFDLLAVTEDQIDEWSLPTRPPKPRDRDRGWSRAVELDAIPPDKLRQLVADAIVDEIDADAWQKEQTVEQSELEILMRMTPSE